MTEESFPLQWPEGRSRTPFHKQVHSRFDTTPGVAQMEMVDEIRRMGGKNIIISSNLRTRKDGGIYSGELNRSKDDSGVAVYFTRNDQRICFCCDQYKRAWENMRAIGKTIAAMRGIERWGSTEMLDRAFKGFAALPSPDHKKSWREILGVKPNASPSIERVTERYKELAKRRHPDSPTGSTEKFQELQNAFEEAKLALS